MDTWHCTAALDLEVGTHGRIVIRDGLEQTEYAVREANAGLAELDAGKGIPLGQARRRAEARRRHSAPADR